MTHRTGSSIFTLCPTCEGTGYCQNEYHNGFGFVLIDTMLPGNDKVCPACGEKERPGKCSTCGGDGH